MEETNFTPEESLLLIAKTIEETKRKFEENGYLLLFWGILIFIVTLSQFLIASLNLNIGIGLPALLYPLAAIYTFIFFQKKEKRNKLPKTILGNIIQAMGIVLGANLLILGFLFHTQLGLTLIPIFLILLSFWTIICGVAIKFKPLLIGGILLNLSAFIAFFIKWQYHFLIMSFVSVVAFIIPGLLFNKEIGRASCRERV